MFVSPEFKLDWQYRLLTWCFYKFFEVLSCSVWRWIARHWKYAVMVNTPRVLLTCYHPIFVCWRNQLARAGDSEEWAQEWAVVNTAVEQYHCHSHCPADNIITCDRYSGPGYWLCSHPDNIIWMFHIWMLLLWRTRRSSVTQIIASTQRRGEKL